MSQNDVKRKINDLVKGIDLPSEDGRYKVGVIGVDAGLCWIGDPCYILHKEDDSPKAIGKDWDEFVDSLYAEKEDGFEAHQFKYDLGHDGLGVAVSTGYGDGEYPVYVTIRDGRVKKVEVVFF